ncbi:helix-turn-helix domain-containing protein [Inquilinus limosus]|uniref:GlxA family transcriptional regulator n=1 Tax=Inquilinus limosus TaxID=171674 RepID=UPI003F183102
MNSPIRVSIIAVAEIEPWIVVGVHDAFWAVGTLWNRVMGERENPRFLPEIVAAAPGPLRTGTGVRIEPHRTIDDDARTDIVFVSSLLISSGAQFGRDHPDVVDWVRRSYARGAHVVSSCTGSFLLAEAGLLDDREATTHWAFVDMMRAEYPRVRILGDRILVSATDDHRIVTAGGATSWTDLVLYIVGRFAGAEEARRLAKMSLFDWHHDGQNPYSRLTTRPQSGDRLVRDCQEWLASHYADADPVAAMIRRSGLSRRGFNRRFRQATGHAPLDYVQRVRIEEAKQILETTDQPVDAIAVEVGYGDPVSFRRLFKRLVHDTPAAYRRRQRVPEAVRRLGMNAGVTEVTSAGRAGVP